MKQVYKRPYQYRFTQPPKALLKAKLDNIAIIPASLLPFKKILQEQMSKLPHGAVFLCHIKENNRQRKLLERVESVFKQHGHAVTNLSMEQVVLH
jgi:pyruvoyl-dependent arginine decarboxylase (PvlArgDC)